MQGANHKDAHSEYTDFNSRLSKETLRLKSSRNLGSMVTNRYLCEHGKPNIKMPTVNVQISMVNHPRRPQGSLRPKSSGNLGSMLSDRSLCEYGKKELNIKMPMVNNQISMLNHLEAPRGQRVAGS